MLSIDELVTFTVLVFATTCHQVVASGGKGNDLLCLSGD